MHGEVARQVTLSEMCSTLLSGFVSSTAMHAFLEEFFFEKVLKELLLLLFQDMDPVFFFLFLLIEPFFV